MNKLHFRLKIPEEKKKLCQIEYSLYVAFILLTYTLLFFIFLLIYTLIFPSVIHMEIKINII